MSEHTPGPWALVDAGDSEFATVKAGTWEFVTAQDPECGSMLIADARLIAAAPDLLAALKALLQWTTEEYQSNADIDAQARTAIAKAEGR